MPTSSAAANVVIVESTRMSQVNPEPTNSNAFSNGDEIEDIQWAESSSIQWAQSSSTQWAQSSSTQWGTSPSTIAFSKSAIKSGSVKSNNGQSTEKKSPTSNGIDRSDAISGITA
ncbi:unnamed protein product [Rotaria sp. Silwood1]|nr:unnamed protein product [Rotaria sp. Silwood1]